MRLDGNSVVAAAWDVKTQSMGKGNVIVRPSTNEFFALDEVGSLLWQMITPKPIALHWLAEAITKNYPRDYYGALEDVKDFCRGLCEENLLSVEKQKDAAKCKSKSSKKKKPTSARSSRK